MAIAYFDSSALVKLLVEEEGSDIAAAIWDGCDAVVSSRIAYVEVRAALTAAGRGHRLLEADQRHAELQWEAFWASIRAVELTRSVSAHAGRLAAEYALRGADAIHLASALAIGADDLLFVVWDERLRAAVARTGVRLAPNADR